MPMTDPFSATGFDLMTLTAMMNNLPFQPGKLTRLGLWEEKGVPTLSVAVEEQGGTLKVVPITARGAPGDPVQGKTRKLHSFIVPHIPQTGAVMADEVQGVREFGKENGAEVLTARVNEELAMMRSNIDYTLEAHRMQNIQGMFYDNNGTLVSAYTTFGVAEQSVAMALDTATTSVRGKCLDIIQAVEGALGGLPYSGLRAECGASFWRKLITHAKVEETYLNTQQASELRGDVIDDFEFGGITWSRYRSDGVVEVPTAEARVIPTGVSGLFLTRFGPANYKETVNTIGLPYYAKQQEMPFGKGMELESQSNPFSICTRPRALIKLPENT